MINQLTEKQKDNLRQKNTIRHNARLDSAYQEIDSMDYEYAADIGLAYASPVRGVWNIVHIGTLVPGGHQVFVCPTSCLRGVVLTTAEMGRMDKMSTITVGEDNILEGDMEEMLQRGVERIIEELPKKPRMMMIFTSCIHHFMAVNYKRVYKILAKEYPEIDFIDCYMDPIMRRTSPVVPSLWRQMHRALRPSEEKNSKQVNFIGNCFAHNPATCDLSAMLENAGIQYKEANSCNTYEEFLAMGNSCCNFVFHGSGVVAAKDMQVRLGQPWRRMRPDYTYAHYDEDLTEAANQLAIAPPTRAQLGAEKDATEAAVQAALDTIGNTPVSIDYTAVDCPLALAIYLLRHGFNVESVMIDNFTESEDVFRELQALRPELRIYETYGWNIRQMPRGHEGKILCIGQKSAYFMNSNYFVNEVENAGMYGYRGIRHLMDLMTDAVQNEKPMKELVQIKGWECHCCD